MRSLAAFATVATLAAGSAHAQAGPAELVMVEEVGCPWCARFDREIGPIYPKTSEARRAPLRRIDLRAPVPQDLTLASPPRVTPTFILVEAGVEVARIEGYPGEDLFWQMLTRMLTELETE